MKSRDAGNNVLIITTWFPNPVEPMKCIFIRNILNAQKLYTDYNPIVISPTAFFPKFLSPFFSGRYVQLSKIPFLEQTDNDIMIFRPKYFKLPRQWSKPLDWFFYYRAVIKTVKRAKIKFDLIHAHGLYPDAYVAYRVANYFKVPYICHAHDSYLEKLYTINKNKISISLSLADKIIAVSWFQAAEIAKILPQCNNVEVVYNGIFTENFGIKSNRTINNRLVYIGNLLETKGIFVLLRSMAILKKENCKIYLDAFGRGDLALFESSLITLGIEDIVSFKNVINNNELPQALKEYDFLVLPSFYETFGIVLIEAMACGLPVIASNIAAIPEIINSDKFGILVEPGNELELANAIKKALEMKWDSNEIRKYAEKYSIKNTALSIDKIYDNILNQDII